MFNMSVAVSQDICYELQHLIDADAECFSATDVEMFSSHKRLLHWGS